MLSSESIQGCIENGLFSCTSFGGNAHKESDKQNVLSATKCDILILSAATYMTRLFKNGYLDLNQHADKPQGNCEARLTSK